MSWVLLRLLAPLFRYSDWRDAWVLRMIGERWGPVLIRHSDWMAEQSTVQPPLIELRSPLTLLAVLAALIAATLGFTIARSSGNGGSHQGGESSVSSGSLRVVLPAGWHRAAPPASQSVSLSDELVLRPASTATGTLLVGRAAIADSATLARSFLGTLPRASDGEAVVLGGARFTRYVAGTATHAVQARKSVYVLPTTVGTVVGVCLASERGGSFTASCERILGSLRVGTWAGSSTLPPGYAAGLITTIGRLDAVRASAGAQLAAARNALHQAIAARKLATAHANAAAALLRLSAGPASNANAAVAAALRGTSQSYGALALAAGHSDARGYANATASLRHASATMKSAFVQLQAFGFRVG